jgi:hypothetical protein
MDFRGKQPWSVRQLLQALRSQGVIHLNKRRALQGPSDTDDSLGLSPVVGYHPFPMQRNKQNNGKRLKYPPG